LVLADFAFSPAPDAYRRAAAYDPSWRSFPIGESLEYDVQKKEAERLLKSDNML